MAPVAARGWLKPLRCPGCWLALWALALATVAALSLLTLPPGPELPPNSDKVEHFLAYFALAASAVQLFRARAVLAGVGLGLVAMGVALEFAQGAMTTTRMQDPLDALANTLGVLAGLALALTPARDLLLRLAGRERGRR